MLRNETAIPIPQPWGYLREVLGRVGNCRCPRLQSCNIEEPLPTQTLPAPAKEKEKKKNAKGDDFLNCISTCLEGRYFSRRCL